MTGPARARVFVRYSKKGEEPVILELYGDPFEICRKVAEGMGLTIINHDPGFHAVMRNRLLRQAA